MILNFLRRSQQFLNTLVGKIKKFKNWFLIKCSNRNKVIKKQNKTLRQILNKGFEGQDRSQTAATLMQSTTRKACAITVTIGLGAPGQPILVATLINAITRKDNALTAMPTHTIGLKGERRNQLRNHLTIFLSLTHRRSEKILMALKIVYRFYLLK